MLPRRFPRPVPAGPIEERPYTPNTWWLLIICCALGGVLLGAGFSAFFGRGYVQAREYHLWRWQADTVLNIAFARLGIGPDPTDSAGEPAITNYFRLTSQIRTALESNTPDFALADTLTSERAVYENDVERIIGRWITEATEGVGLKHSLPLFNGVTFTWPPVAFELTSPPRLLVRSDRDEIKRAGDTLLKNDLNLAEIEKIEAQADDDDTVSIVVSIGGLAAYPAIVRDDRSFAALLETASHEWVHHYLAFYPLGLRFGKGSDGTTLNETTAELAGREIAKLISAAHPLELPPGEDGRIAAGPAPTVDFNAEMRKLRIEVDDLLAAGKVEEAESLMEERRRYLVANGIQLRKLNQAYFAFYGSYAGSSQSGSDPIGPQVNRVWELTGDVGTFLRLMREVESTAELNSLVTMLETLPRP